MTIETEILDIQRRLQFLEAEVGVFTPPISRLQREIMSFRLEMTERFEVDRLILSGLSDFRTETNRRLEALEARLGAVEERLSSLETKADRILLILEKKFPPDETASI